jgi:hypothetical protein
MERNLKRLSPFIAGVIILGMYLLTLAPTLVQIDSGELATSQLTLGICHPTGYPLFTMVGYLFGKLPLGLSPIYKVNLLAALWCTGAVMLFVQTSIMIFEFLPVFVKKPVDTSSKKAKKKKAPAPVKIEAEDETKHPLVPYFSAIAGGLILGLSKTFWDQSTSVEVYSMECFMFMSIIWSTLYAYFHSLNDADNGFKYWFLMSLALVGGFTTHMTTLFTLPAIAYLFFTVYGFKLGSFKKIGLLMLAFFPLLALIYMYLPIRAAQNPIMNWGNPVDWERMYRLMSGNQYSNWMFSSFDAAKKQFIYFINNLPSEFNVSAVFIVIGLFYFYIRAKKVAIFFTILALFTLAYAINYDINDIDSYFLLTYIALAFFGVFGIKLIFKLLHDKKYEYGLAFIAILIFLGIQIYFTIDKVDQHDDYIFEDYTKAALMNADKDAVIFSYQWDNFVSPAYYLQHIENVRPDVTVIDKELLRRSWYYNMLQRNCPEAIASLKPEIGEFLKGLQKFERNEKFDPQFLETYYKKIMTGIVEANASHRPFYIGIELFEREMAEKSFTLPEGYTLVPDLFYFRVVKGNAYVPAHDPDFIIRQPRFDSEYTSSIKQIICSMLVRRALYEMQFDKRDRAITYIKKIRQDFPDYTIPEGLAEVISH